MASVVRAVLPTIGDGGNATGIPGNWVRVPLLELAVSE